MKRIFLLAVCLAVMSAWWGCGGGSDALPSGSKLFLVPSDDLTVESASSTIGSADQQFIVAARDPLTTPPAATDTNALPGGRGIRDVKFAVSFEFTTPPGQQALADTASAVTLCDGTRIINSGIVERMTDDEGNYNLCVRYKAGGGLSYTGRLVVSSGDQLTSVKFEVTSTPPELAVSPTSLTVPAGSLAQFTIVGGVPNYTITASPAVLLPSPSVVTSSGGSFAVAIPLGTAEGFAETYTITDAVGKQVLVSLTVSRPSSLPQVLPGSADVLPGGSARFTVVNGYPPYTVLSSNALITPSPSTVETSGGSFNVIVPLTVQSGTVTLTVRDTAGSTADARLNVVSPPALKLTPTSVNVPAGGSALFVVTGGIAPYVVTTSQSSVVASPSTVLASGGTFRVSPPADMPTSSVTVTVTDILGNQATASMTVTGISPTPNPVISPASVPVSSATGGAPSFIITDGTPPYAVVSSDANRAYFGTAGTGQVTGIPSGGTVTVTVPVGAAVGTVTLTVGDNGGGSASATITIGP